MEPGVYARFDTTEGTFTVKLFDQEAPKTVANFIGLADGSKEWKDPVTGEKKSVPFYDGVVFHRVINGFMIQGGDRLGQGTGGPGYQFADEFHQSLRHDRAGILSMANSGPNSNGSQFFITLGPQPHLDRRHSVFGTTAPAYCRWPTPVRTATAASSSSRSGPRPISIGGTRSSAPSSRG